MQTEKKQLSIRILVIVTFIAMVVINALANILPINGIGSGEVSDLYANLFAPAGITFTIWSLIYVLLGTFSIYQLGVFQKEPDKMPNTLLNEIGLYFSLSSIANFSWIFAWHYQIIWLSLILMFVIFALLALIYMRIWQATKTNTLTMSEQWFIRLPFSVYFGWITIATIANIITFLVSIGFTGFGVAESVWMIIIVLVGMLIGGATIFLHRDAAYGLVLIWAYVGIIIKHMSANGFNNAYPEVIWTVSGALVVLSLLVLYSLYTMFFSKKS
ncbi:MAG: tryptophan-rich sensory protein [Culicoidibacterales bacterium]